jgi:hypothetical protein
VAFTLRGERPEITRITRINAIFRAYMARHRA